MGEPTVTVNNNPISDFKTLMSRLGAETKQKLFSVAEIESKFTNSNRAKRLTSKIFMGLVNTPPQSCVSVAQSNSKVLVLTARELTSTGVLQKAVRVAFHKTVAEKLQNSLLKRSSEGDKIVILVTSPTVQRRSLRQNPNEYAVEFHVGTDPQEEVQIFRLLKLGPSYAEPKETRGPTYSYVSLQEASKNLLGHSHFYAVVKTTVKEPAASSSGLYHGMYAIVDPSCFDTAKRMDYLFHVMASSLHKYPRAQAGDILRAHRARAQQRPARSDQTDLRVFSEKDIVVFPLNDTSNPVSHAAKFTFTEEDQVKLQQLKDWALSHGFGPAVPRRLKTLAEVKPGEAFDLVCRVHSVWEENEFHSLWVEDGTSCPFYTMVNTNQGRIDPQDTQDFSKDVYQIYLACPKHLAKGLTLQKDLCLHLRGVQPVVMPSETEETIVRFGIDVNGSVELIQKNTRYYDALMKRLDKITGQTNASNQHEAPMKKVDKITEEMQTNDSDTAQAPKEDSFDRLLAELPSADFKNLTPQNAKPVARISDGAKTPERPVSRTVEPSLPVEEEDLCTYNSHASGPVRQTLTDSCIAVFAPPIASTQKSPSTPDVAEVNAQTVVQSSTETDSLNSENSLRKRRPETPQEDVSEKRSRLEITHSSDPSSDLIGPHDGASIEEPPVIYRANDEVISLSKVPNRTEERPVLARPEVRVKQETLDSIEVDEDEVRAFTPVEIDEIPCAVEEPHSGESVVVLEPCTQPNIDDILAEQARDSVPFVANLAELKNVKPDTLVKLKACLQGLSPGEPKVDDILTGYCTFCHRMWEYRHFKDLRVGRQTSWKRAAKESRPLPETRVANFLCDRNAHAQFLEDCAAELDSLPLDQMEDKMLNDSLYKADFADSFVCPLCKENGIPGTGCRLVLTFFFQLKLQDETEQIDILAAGVHAEYFLGMKADAVGRTAALRDVLQKRLEQLVQKGGEPTSLTLLVRPVQQHSVTQYLLENTFIVYEENHVLTL